MGQPIAFILNHRMLRCSSSDYGATKTASSHALSLSALLAFRTTITAPDNTTTLLPLDSVKPAVAHLFAVNAGGMNHVR